MSWFHRKTEEDQRRGRSGQGSRDQEASQDQEASLQALAKGGLPLEAQRRLQDLRQREDRFFTSNLSVDEFLLARQAGFRPIAQVTGSSVYHVGSRTLPASTWSATKELTPISDAFNRARKLALGRLELEAKTLGADAVIGVHVTRSAYDWAEDLIEFITVGTAIRLEGAKPAAHPALSNLSGQDFWKLYRSGFWPLGVVGATSVYFLLAGYTPNATKNEELGGLVRGVKRARDKVLKTMQKQPAVRQAAGIVGMQIEEEMNPLAEDEGEKYTYVRMIFTFHALGTCITELPEPQPPSVQAAVDMGAARATRRAPTAGVLAPGSPAGDSASSPET